MHRVLSGPQQWHRESVRRETPHTRARAEREREHTAARAQLDTAAARNVGMLEDLEDSAAKTRYVYGLAGSAPGLRLFR